MSHCRYTPAPAEQCHNPVSYWLYAEFRCRNVKLVTGNAQLGKCHNRQRKILGILNYLIILSDPDVQCTLLYITMVCPVLSCCTVQRLILSYPAVQYSTTVNPVLSFCTVQYKGLSCLILLYSTVQWFILSILLNSIMVYPVLSC